MQNSDQAVVYVATGDKYIKEAEYSIKSLLTVMPDIKIYLFSDRATSISGLYKNLIIENPAYSFVDKIFSIQQVEEKYVIFLDSDTYISAPVYELFEILNRFELACSRAPVRIGYKVDVPDAFSELNTGVICFRNIPRVSDFFNRWRDFYSKQIKSLNPPHDQSSFRKVLWESDINFYMLPPEYNCRLVFPAHIFDHAKIYHCRFINVEKVSIMINKRIFREKHLVYLPFPDADIIIGDGNHIRISENLSHCWFNFLIERTKDETDNLLDCINTATAMLHFKDTDASDQYVKEVIEKIGAEPTYLRLFYTRLLKIGKVEEAIYVISLHLALKPNDSDTLYDLSRAFARANRFTDAIKEVKKAISLKNNIANYHFHIGNLYLKIGDFQNAEISLRTAIAKKPDFPIYHRNLSVILARQGKMIEAIEEALNAIALDAYDPTFHNQLGNLYFKQGEIQNAENSMKRAIELDPDKSDYYRNLSSIFYRQRKLKEAIDYAKKAIVLNPENPAYHHHLGNLWLRKGNLERAESSLRMAIRIDPKKAIYHRHLYSALFRQGRKVEAIEHIKTAILLDDKNAEYHSP